MTETDRQTDTHTRVFHNNTFLEFDLGALGIGYHYGKDYPDFFSEFFDAIFIAAGPEVNIRPKVGGAVTTRSTSSLIIVESSCSIPLYVCFLMRGTHFWPLFSGRKTS